ncbi:hypothetical protein ACLB2K_070000 [Fragaria x ananassa]
MADETTFQPLQNWSELPIDVLELILSKLSVRYILRLQAVSRSFYNAVKYVLQSSSSSFTCLAEPPWIYLGVDRHRGFRFQSLDQDRKIYHLNQNKMARKFRDHICVGSSQSWLLLLGKTLDLTLLNPIFAVQFPLPPCSTIPCFIPFDQRSIFYNANEFSTVSVWLSQLYPVRVSIMYGEGPYHIAYCTTDADGEWTNLLDKYTWKGLYMNSCRYLDQLYALREDMTVEVWDFSTSLPVKRMEIRADHAPVVPKRRNRAVETVYIAKTVEDLLIVTKWGNVCVYKLDYNSDGSYRWVETESIGNSELVLKGYESLLTSKADDATEGSSNSVYFTSGGSRRLFAYSLREKRAEPVKDLAVSLPLFAKLFDPNPSFFY